MNREEAVYELPEGLQQPAARAQSFLAESRTELSRAMTAADEERAAATAELRREHLRRTGRLEE